MLTKAEIQNIMVTAFRIGRNDLYGMLGIQTECIRIYHCIHHSSTTLNRNPEINHQSKPFYHLPLQSIAFYE